MENRPTRFRIATVWANRTGGSPIPTWLSPAFPFLAFRRVRSSFSISHARDADDRGDAGARFWGVEGRVGLFSFQYIGLGEMKLPAGKREWDVTEGGEARDRKLLGFCRSSRARVG